jgi:hypothetical protein
VLLTPGPEVTLSWFTAGTEMIQKSFRGVQIGFKYS